MVGIAEAAVSALSFLLTWPTVGFLLLGTFIGMTFGAIPGLGGTIALALLAPLTFDLAPNEAMALLSATLGGVAFGGSLSAILINTPGTPPNAATCLDGYPMARAGRAGEAIGISATASALGAVFGLGILVLLLPVARELILAFSPPEFFWLAITGLVMVASVTQENRLKAYVSGGLGIMLGFVGFSGRFATYRYGFGTEYLWGGVGLLPVLVGLFAIGEMIELTKKGGSISAGSADVPGGSSVLKGGRTVLEHPFLFLRSSAIGTVVGLVPDTGGAIANFIAYAQAVQTSDDPDSFGSGDPRRIIASEASNDAKDGGALLPTVVFGIPGSIAMAVLLGTFSLHGLTPGGQLLNEQLDVLMTIILSLLFANILTSITGLTMASRLSLLTRIDVRLISPVILFVSFMGIYALNTSVGDLVLTLVFGLVGYAMIAFDYSRLTLILGLLLGPLAERSFHQSMNISDIGALIFVTRPISLALILLLILSVLLPLVRGNVGRWVESRL